MTGVNDRGEVVEAGSPEDNRPRSQVDLEQRLAADFSPRKMGEQLSEQEKLGTPVSYAVEGNDTSGYIGVSPEYMTYASATEAPLQGTEGAEAQAGYLQTQPLRQVKTEKVEEGKQITGVGSSDPVIYSEVSGEIFKTEQVTVKDGEEPDTVEDVEKLKAKDAPVAGAKVVPAAAPKNAGRNRAPQGTDSGDKTTDSDPSSSDAPPSVESDGAETPSQELPKPPKPPKS